MFLNSPEFFGPAFPPLEALVGAPGDSIPSPHLLPASTLSQWALTVVIQIPKLIVPGAPPTLSPDTGKAALIPQRGVT